MCPSFIEESGRKESSMVGQKDDHSEWGEKVGR